MCWPICAVNERFRNIPVLVVSAFAHKEERKQAEAAGANEYLVKPFGIQELFAVVSRLLGERDES